MDILIAILLTLASIALLAMTWYFGFVSGAKTATNHIERELIATLDSLIAEDMQEQLVEKEKEWAISGK